MLSINTAGRQRFSSIGGTAYGIPRNANELSSKRPSTLPQLVTASTYFPSRIGAVLADGDPDKANNRIHMTRITKRTIPPIIARSSKKK